MKQGKHKLKQTTTDGKGFKRNNMKLTTNANEETERMRSVIQKGLCRYRRHETRVSSSTRGFKSIQSKHEHRNTRDDEESSESSDKGIFAEFSLHILHIPRCLFGFRFPIRLASATRVRCIPGPEKTLLPQRPTVSTRGDVQLCSHDQYDCDADGPWPQFKCIQMRGKEEKKQLNVSRHRNFRSSHWSIVLEAQRRCVVFGVRFRQQTLLLFGYDVKVTWSHVQYP